MDLGMDCMLGPMTGNEQGHFIFLHQQHGQILCGFERQLNEPGAAQTLGK
jgi:hypothetical protein